MTMDRRKSIKNIALGAIAPNFIVTDTSLQLSKNLNPEKKVFFESGWNKWPDMEWVGPEYWGNRLQDWHIQSGKAICQISAPNRTLHNLTTQITASNGSFQSSVKIKFINAEAPKSSNYHVGFRIGAKGPFEDYRSAAVFGKGIDIGITPEGKIFIDGERIGEYTDFPEEVLLMFKATPKRGNTYSLTMEVFNPHNNELLISATKTGFSSEQLEGNIALLSSVGDRKYSEDIAAASFSDWKISGTKLNQKPEQVYGPICFAQYTLHNKILKLTAQLAPVERVLSNTIKLQVKINGGWKTIATASIDPMARTAGFRIKQWDQKTSIPYRIKLVVPLRNSEKEFYYQGSIAGEPKEDANVKAAVFSCNADYGFPDSDIAPNIAFHRPDLTLFLGDQFYESTGGFGVQRTPMDKATLDYLRKWMMFGWSYRDIFRHIPCAIIPDDHDVYHGNVWGEGGKAADTSLGWGAAAQDSGGYKMPPEWVNMVQKTQTSHLPDAFDPTPVKQGIDVYYTHWNYGGISFAILEDRKFKSAPANILPPEAEVVNSFVQNLEFDIKSFDSSEADLLGSRQLNFLEQWAQDWSNKAQMKAILSQTIFNTVSTLPEGSTSGAIIPKLKIPELGEYVPGDTVNADMDTNGWPKTGRDAALEKIRKCYAFHIAGDQHLASFSKYGVDTYGDSGFAFAGPALNNLWPRRWWPPVENAADHTVEKPAYTGNFEDGFGNKMTIKAVANPRQTGIEPTRIYDRATGYGLVTFNKKDRTIHTECWPRYEDPAKNPNGQYAGWPTTVTQEDNYGRKPVAWLPEIKVNGIENPVIAIINEDSGELVYILRINGKKFTPKVFTKGRYTIKVSDPDKGIELQKNKIKASAKPRKTLLFSA